jgi:2-dehydropantoate 2-reductase
LSKRIVFVGAGALGGYVGGHLTRAGNDVTLIDPWPEHVETMRKHGIQLSGTTPAEKHSVPVNVMHIRMLGMDPEVLARAGEKYPDALAEIIDVLVEGAKKRSADQRPSMAQDIAKGRRTETDYINGFIAARGTEIGIPAPIQARMHEVVKRVERGEAKPSPELIAGW